MSVTVTSAMTQYRVDTFWDKEPKTLLWIDTFQPGDLFLDIGANMGLYSLYAALTRGVAVLAFEPESSNYALLNKNIFLNGLDQKIQAYALALSDEIALNALHLSQVVEGAGCNSFKDKLDFKEQPLQSKFSQGCFAVTLDFLTEQQFIPIPQHIKIDVDGIEHKILNGAKRTLAHPAVRSVLVELNTNLLSHLQIIPFMEELGFTYSQEQVELEQCAGPFQGMANYIFIRKP